MLGLSLSFSDAAARRVAQGGSPTPTPTPTPTPSDTTAPLFTSASSRTVPENSAFSMTLAANETATFALAGGADVSRFALSGTTLSMVARDFDAPIDANTDNVYNVIVRATDAAGNFTDQAIDVTVTNVFEGAALAALTLSDVNLVTGAPKSGTILGAKSGTPIVGSNLPAGFTIDAAARTWAWDGTGSVSTPSITLVETQADTTNSPRTSIIPLAITAPAAGNVAPTISASMPYVGRATTAEAPSWGTAPSSVSREWRRIFPAALGGATVVIPGATGYTYNKVAADKYCQLQFAETGDGVTLVSEVTSMTMPPLAAGGTLSMQGDSIGAGLNANSTNNDVDPAYAWAKQVANAFGLTLKNDSVGSRTLAPQLQSPNSNNLWSGIFVNGFGVGADKKDNIFLVAGGNDAFGGPSYSTPANCAVYLRRTVGYLLASGMSRDTIWVGGMYHIEQAGLTQQGVTLATWLSFNAAIKSVTIEYGLPFFDFYALTPGAGDISSDNVHPTRQGHTNIASAIATGRPFATPIPTVPNVLPAVAGAVITGGVGSATVAWTAYDGATGYTVKIIDATTFVEVTTVTSAINSASIPTLAAGSYFAAVSATVPGGTAPFGQSATSAVVTATEAPTYFLQSTFSGGANGQNISTYAPEIGGAWVVGAGGMALTAAGRVYPSANGTFVYNTATPPSADYFVDTAIDYLSSAPNETVYVGAGRANAAALSWYQLAWLPSGVWTIQKTTAGSTANVGPTYADAFTSNRFVRVRYKDNVITVTIDGTVRLTYTDTNGPFLAAGKVGMGGGLATSPTTGRQITRVDAAA